MTAIRERLLIKDTSWLPVGQLVLFVASFAVFLRTMSPTLYNLDSAELATGAASLGIVHAPGYPLYLLAAHLFTYLPIGDVAFRVNLFSAVCVAIAVPVLYVLVDSLLNDKWIAAGAALTFVWSFYVWSTGIVAEARSNLLMLALCGWAVVRLYRGVSLHRAVLVGLLFGLAVAINPQSILFAPGLIVVFLALRIPWRQCLIAGVVSLIPFLLATAYFPIRYAAQPALNMAGQYNADGLFQQVNLQSLQGLWWMLSGAQFRYLFFTEGLLPSLDHLLSTLSWFWGNYLGIGFILGLVGAYLLLHTQPKVFWCWLAFFLPYTYFFTTYGAEDRDSMFAPSYLLWTIVLAYGLQWLIRSIAPQSKPILVFLLPLILLTVNFQRLDLSHDTSVRANTQSLMTALPANARVFGGWWDIVPLQYLQIVEGQRPDVHLYNTFLFQKPDVSIYVQQHIADAVAWPLVFLNSAIPYIDSQCYTLDALGVNSAITYNSSGLFGGFILSPKTGHTSCR